MHKKMPENLVMPTSGSKSNSLLPTGRAFPLPSLLHKPPAFPTPVWIPPCDLSHFLPLFSSCTRTFHFCFEDRCVLGLSLFFLHSALLLWTRTISVHSWIPGETCALAIFRMHFILCMRVEQLEMTLAYPFARLSLPFEHVPLFFLLFSYLFVSTVYSIRVGNLTIVFYVA